jgi:hypothetical protein
MSTRLSGYIIEESGSKHASSDDVAEGEDPYEAEEDDERGDPQGEKDDDESLPLDGEEGKQETGGVYV